MGEVLQAGLAQAQTAGKRPKNFLFFSPSAASQQAAAAFLSRLDARKAVFDEPIRNESIHAQVVAITKWGLAKLASLAGITQPVLVVNGDEDVMAPTLGTFDLFLKLPKAELSVFPDAGHGAIFQYQPEFVRQALAFLAA
jgi:pimeloyl-ACP methyl ester carboxylesterase